MPKFHLPTAVSAAPESLQGTTIEAPSIPIPTPEEVETILFGPNRPTYVGRYRHPKVIEKEKQRLDGDLKDLEVGKMICVQAKDCPYGRPFWLAKVEKIKTFENGVPDIISILWYACSSETDDPLTAKYCEEFAPLDRCDRGKKKREKAPLHRQDIQISSTTIFYYNFELSKARRMFQTTTKTIELKLQAHLNELSDHSINSDDDEDDVHQDH
jgi:hypothetical protein